MFEESFTPLDETTRGIQVEKAAENSLRSAGKWGRFIAIVNFVFIGITVLSFLVGGVSSIYMLATMGGGPEGGIFATLFFGIMGLFLAFGIYLNYKLYDFSKNAIIAADSGNTRAFTQSIGSLSTLFKVFGILTAAVVGFYALMFLLMLLFSGMSAIS